MSHKQRSIGERLAKHSFTGIAIDGKEDLVETIIQFYEYRQASIGEGTENAMECLENDRCLLVGFNIDLKRKAHKQLWSDVANMSLGKPLTRQLMRKCLLELREKELFALLGIASQNTLKELVNHKPKKV